MIYTQHIQKALGYIERNMAEACTLEDCAAAAGYSAYHFIRIFKDVTGFSPMDYVRKRRLSAAARDVAESKDSILDIAVKWGFESSETFIRAFEAEHGLTPGRYRSTGICLHLTSPFRILTGTPFALPEPMILELPERVLCGFPLYLECGMRHGTIPSFFNQYHQKRLAYLLPGVPADGRFDDVGCSIYEGKRRLAYIVGVWTDRLGPPGTVSVRIAGGLHAVFDTPHVDAYTFVESVHNTWDAIYGQWLPASGFERAPGPDYETYCEVSRKYSERIYIPVARKESSS